MTDQPQAQKPPNSLGFQIVAQDLLPDGTIVVKAVAFDGKSLEIDSLYRLIERRIENALLLPLSQPWSELAQMGENRARQDFYEASLIRALNGLVRSRKPEK